MAFHLQCSHNLEVDRSSLLHHSFLATNSLHSHLPRNQTTNSLTFCLQAHLFSLRLNQTRRQIFLRQLYRIQLQPVRMSQQLFKHPILTTSRLICPTTHRIKSPTPATKIKSATPTIKSQKSNNWK